MKIYNELESLGFFEWLSETHNLSDTDMKPKYLDELPLNDIHRTACNSMAFRWFREKHQLWFRPDYYDELKEYDFQGSIHKLGKYNAIADIGNHETPEEAELACLERLIEIVKQR